MAGSPPVAERLGLPIFHFVHRQFLYLLPAAALALATSFLSPRHVRRAALMVFLVGMAMIVAALLFGHEVKGSKRWIFGIQPSEFVKPAFVIMAAWAFAEGVRRKDLPGNLVAMALLPLTVAPLILQPDFGQTMLICLIWGALFFMAGLHGFWLIGLPVSWWLGFQLRWGPAGLWWGLTTGLVVVAGCLLLRVRARLHGEVARVMIDALPM